MIIDNQITLRYKAVFPILLQMMDILRNIELSETKECKDLEAEVYHVFYEWLVKEFPLDGLLVEDFDPRAQKNNYMWVFDPIDGTSNMHTGVSFFSIPLALVFEKEVLALSFIMDIRSERIYVAYGENNQIYHLQTKEWEEVPHSLSKLMKEGEYVLMGRLFGHSNRNDLDDFRDDWWHLAKMSKSYRQLGSIALQMVLDGYKRRMILFCLDIRWFDVLASLHFLKNLGYEFQVSKNQECLFVNPAQTFLEPLDKLLTTAKKKWEFFPSNTFKIDR